MPSAGRRVAGRKADCEPPGVVGGATRVQGFAKHGHRKIFLKLADDQVDFVYIRWLKMAKGRVALGDCSPRAPADPSLKEFCVSRPPWRVSGHTLRASRQTGLSFVFLVLVYWVKMCS